MPFKSKAQQRFMHMKHPEIAKRWEKHTRNDVKLPERVDESMSIKREILKINELMEDINSAPHMSGGSTAQVAMMVPPDVTTIVSEPNGYGGVTAQEEPEFSELELRLARRFIELVGGAERARDLVNKCNECQDCLGLIDDDHVDDIAVSTPFEVDLPTSRYTH